MGSPALSISLCGRRASRAEAVSDGSWSTAGHLIAPGHAAPAAVVRLPPPINGPILSYYEVTGTRSRRWSVTRLSQHGWRSAGKPSWNTDGDPRWSVRPFSLCSRPVGGCERGNGTGRRLEARRSRPRDKRSPVGGIYTTPTFRDRNGWERRTMVLTIA